MQRINRPNDDFREELSRNDIDRICSQHGLPRPSIIAPEDRGNEKVIYYLDNKFALAFLDRTQRNIETLTILERLERIPTPKVIAWSKEDPVLHVSYMITEKCPGIRVDKLWNQLSHEKRLQMLESFGTGTAQYHTITVDEAKRVANELCLSHRVVVDSEQINTQEIDDNLDVREIADNLVQLSGFLNSIGLEVSSTIKKLDIHCKQRLSQKLGYFVTPGLVHNEPWTEHFLIEKSGQTFQLSGCVDIEGIQIADAINEITVSYVSMLGLSREYYQSFKKGYEKFFKFPDDDEELIRLSAIDSDAWCLVELMNHTREPLNSIPNWKRYWIEKTYLRLQGWLNRDQKVARALFRQDIGPW